MLFITLRRMYKQLKYIFVFMKNIVYYVMNVDRFIIIKLILITLSIFYIEVLIIIFK